MNEESFSTIVDKLKEVIIHKQEDYQMGGHEVG